MEKGSPTYNPKQAWTTALLVAGVSLFFGVVVLPYLSPSKSELVGKAAPDFALNVIHGGEPGNRIRLSDLKGKAVVLDFWASWCQACRAQAPIVDRVAREAESSEVMVVGVNTGDSMPDAVRFAQQSGLSFVSVFDDKGVADAFGVRELPTLVVVDKQGRVSAFRTRVVKESELKRLVEEATAG